MTYVELFARGRQVEGASVASKVTSTAPFSVFAPFLTALNAGGALRPRMRSRLVASEGVRWMGSCVRVCYGWLRHGNLLVLLLRQRHTFRGLAVEHDLGLLEVAASVCGWTQLR